MPPIDPAARVEALFPIDGPHSPESTIAAARSTAHLVRYLNHASGPRTRRDALVHPADVAQVVSALGQATAGLHQLCRQLADRLALFADTPGLYDFRGSSPLLLLADSMGGLRTAADMTMQVADVLTAAHEAANRLGVRDDDEGDDR